MRYYHVIVYYKSVWKGKIEKLVLGNPHRTNTKIISIPYIIQKNRNMNVEVKILNIGRKY